MTLTRLKFIHVVKVGELWHEEHQSESHLQEASATTLSLEVVVWLVS